MRTEPLMGFEQCNVKAVPLLRSRAPLVGTGVERLVAEILEHQS